MKSNNKTIILGVAGLSVVGLGIYYYFKSSSSGPSFFSGSAPAGGFYEEPPLSVEKFIQLDEGVRANQLFAEEQALIPQEQIRQFNPQGSVIVRNPDASMFDEATSAEVNEFIRLKRRAESPRQKAERQRRVGQATYVHEISTMDFVNFIEDKKEALLRSRTGGLTNRDAAQTRSIVSDLRAGRNPGGSPRGYTNTNVTRARNIIEAEKNIPKRFGLTPKGKRAVRSILSFFSPKRAS